MCRSIRTLFNFEPPATEAEIHASAVQFVRKLSGFNKPSQANEAAFDRAIEEEAAPSVREAIVEDPEQSVKDRGVSYVHAGAKGEFDR